MGDPALRSAIACYLRDAGLAIGKDRERAAPSLHPGRWVGSQSVPIFRQQICRGTWMGHRQTALRARCHGRPAERTRSNPHQNSLEEIEMTTSVKQMLEAANAAVPKITPTRPST